MAPFTKKDEDVGFDIRKILGSKSRSYNLDDLDLMEELRVFSRSEIRVNIAGNFSRNIELNLPVVAAPTTDVTDPHVAIVAAQNGALGVLPTTYSPEEQASGVRRVKKAEGTFIENPH